ncbi:hypothetical protein [Wolbachia endosymbiont (group B) of Philonthus cognatus]|uniref:hypothetical protein n=1 Tax=Wolbachia endosymbiont (group B) of Philonthus cognatus TaxID=2954047 RepID=UPI00221E697D|nr:hypothetical protein [Wolbachia endosymbiont (group B) of Philonthus cognatus]
MLQNLLTDFNTVKPQSRLIPKGTIVKVKMTIKPGGYEHWFSVSREGEDVQWESDPPG